MTFPVPKKGRPEGSTNTAFKMFKNALNSRFTEDELVHNPQEAKLSMERWVFELALTKPELILREILKDDPDNASHARALIDKIRTETDLLERKSHDDHALAQARIDDTKLASELKRKELNQNQPVEIDNATLDQLMHKMVALDKSTAKKLRKIHQAKNIEDDE